MPRVLTSSIAVLSALLCALSTGLVATPAHAADPLRVLLTGDSITHGRHSDFTWRYRLDREFRRQGVAFNFVGSMSTVYQDAGYPTSTYADANFDRDHFAKAGVQLRELANQIRNEAANQQPDVIVLEAGVNDFRHHADEPGIVEQTELALRTWITNARLGKADTRILISPVLSVDTPMAAKLNPLIAEYNNDVLPEVVEDMSTDESPITLAATNQGWDPKGAMAYDGLHPSSTGEAFIAQKIATALQDADGSYFPQPIGIYKGAAVQWPRTERPAVKVVGNRATVSWSQQTVGGGRVRLQRAGHAAVTSATFHAGGKQVLTVVQGATYDFRVQVRRGRMTGPWGPTVRVRIPAPAKPPVPARVTVTASGVHWTASPRATAYVVKFRKIGQKRWATRRTPYLRIAVQRVAVAQVRALNAGGTSAWRRDYR